ncbi:MAG: hypothetical protein CL916_02535 [Deltaproteobacteria bacterium]|nr:hypothetical protein [Deltaproteobacteria bacterium]
MTHHFFHALYFLFACSNTPSDFDMDYSVPGTWADATRIEEVTQASCNEDMTQVIETIPKASTKFLNDNLIITYPNAHFRCDQSVQAFVKYTKKGYAVLMQPTEMNPVWVAKCDCGYNLETSIPNAKSKELRLFHRGDSFGRESIIREIQVESK